MEILRCLFTPEFELRILLSARSTGKRTTRAAYPRSSLPRTAAPTAPAAYSKEAKGTAGFANSRISRCNAPPRSAAPVRVRDAARRILSVGRRTSGFFSSTWIEPQSIRRGPESLPRRHEGKARLGRRWCRCNLRPRRSTTPPGPLRRRASVSVLPFASSSSSSESFRELAAPRVAWPALAKTISFCGRTRWNFRHSKREQTCSSNRLDFKLLFKISFFFVLHIDSTMIIYRSKKHLFLLEEGFEWKIARCWLKIEIRDSTRVRESSLRKDTFSRRDSKELSPCVSNWKIT